MIGRHGSVSYFVVPCLKKNIWLLDMDQRWIHSVDGYVDGYADYVDGYVDDDTLWQCWSKTLMSYKIKEDQDWLNIIASEDNFTDPLHIKQEHTKDNLA